jgi:hypothetical protein
VALRQYTEGPVRQGVLEPPWQRLVGGVVLGTVEFEESFVASIANRAGPRNSSSYAI